MAIPATLERLGYGADGAIAKGLHRQVIKEAVSTRTLLAKESGSLCLFDTAGGVTFTLPTPIEGMYFDFGLTVTGTGTYKIVTAAVATQFMVGGVQIGSLTLAESADAFTADGTTIASITMDADTKGRILGGGIVRLVGLSATVWHVSGWLVGAGTLATPFATT